MSISSASILVDGTVATTGGTATSLKTKGQDLGQMLALLDDSSEYIDQTTMLFSVTDPKVKADAPNGYTQARASAVVHVPLALDNGNYTKNSIKLELSCDHETTAAEVQSMLVLAAQILHDSDFSDFWKDRTVE